MQIYSGSINQLLAIKIANKLKVKLGKVELSKFPNQEVRVWVKQKKIGKQVAIVQSFANKPNKAVLEFCLLVDALRRAGASEITAIIPWMGYCIQDKIFRQGEPLSARVIADIIEAMKVNRVITVDLHNETTQGFFTTSLTHLSAVPLYIDHFKKTNKIDVIIAPDVGALKETSKLANNLDLPIVLINKQRDLQTGKVKIVSIDGDVVGKKALIVDDFISTGGTLVQTARYLKKQGVKQIIVAVTHHLFVKGVQKKLAQSGIDELYITDTIQPPSEEKFRSTNNLKVKVFSVAELIANSL